MTTDDRTTALHKAALVHGSDLAYLIEQGAQVNAVDADGRTPLHYASKTDDNHVRDLLAAGADPNAVDSAGLTPLHFSLLLGGRCVSRLVASGAMLAAADRNGHTALHHAVHGNRPEATSALLRAGADPRCADLTGETPFDLLDPRLGSGVIDELWLADAQQHGPDRIGQHLQALVDAGIEHRIKMVLNPTLLRGRYSAVGQRGALPLADWHELAAELTVYCVTRRAWSSLHALGECGLPVTLPPAMRAADVGTTRFYDVSPGHEASTLVQAALEGGQGVAPLLQLDPDGCRPALDAALYALCQTRVADASSPTENAVSQNALDLALQMLLAAGARLESRSEKVSADLHAALKLPRDANGDPLWDDERDLGQRNLGWTGFATGLSREIGFTPLLYAVERCSAMVSLLLHAGVDSAATDRFGRGALALLSMQGMVIGARPTVDTLLQAGLPVDAPDANGWRPLMRATHPGVIASLLAHGAAAELTDAERQRLGPRGVSMFEQRIAAAR